MTHLELSEVMLQVVASPTIIILTTLEVSFTLLENIYSRGITHDDFHLRSSYFYSAGHWFQQWRLDSNPQLCDVGTSILTLWGQGKSTYMFSAERLPLSAPPCLLALPTEAWRGAESGRRSAENVYVNLPGPDTVQLLLINYP
jgi:hypothetical protein